MNTNKQLAINIIAQLIAFGIQIGISFFLTPFIVKSLGAAAYGFVGLANNIISYTTLITIALNSMAGRFITISVHQNNIEKANIYFSSVFFSNLLISIFLFIISTILIYYLEVCINIPANLIWDTKALFALLLLNSIIGLVTNVYAVSTFIRNRLELNSIRTIIGNISRAILLIVLFSFFVPHVWYLGISALIYTIYIGYYNYRYTKELTPELHLSIRKYNKKAVKELIRAGAWNLISKLSDILSQGFDLLLANLFISATAMGILSITKTIPIVILSVFALLSSCFAPEWTELYAKKQIDKLKDELLKSIRILGIFSSIPLTILYVYGDVFYKLWIPGENNNLLYTLTIASTIGMVCGLPQESLWNIFTITNQVKKSSLNLLYNSIIIIIIVLIGIYSVESDTAKLFILASTRTIVGLIRVLTFLPIYGAKCLGLRSTIFYRPIIINILSILILSFFSFLIKNYLLEDNWISLCISIILTTVLGIIINSYLVLTPADRNFLWKKIQSKL
ncbi:lipopolysaccharide biosynthesis protein [Phocaeicola barnesiae]|uniref:lipopolysaccharide biosynthesis protein n=1 Tax=Phocaeicola barnesiae TaxID=376804 RepID=UPI000360FD12|nr:oligosaccharide flippase family protein [Phocaeicola barnesiae]